MEQFVRMAEDDARRVCAIAKRDVTAFGQSLNTTLFCDHSLNHIRKLTRRLPSNNPGPAGVWHRAWTQPFGEIDRPAPAVDVQAAAVTTKELPKALHRVTKDTRLDEKDLDGIHSKKPHWATQGGAHMRSAGLRMAVAVKLEGDYSRIRRTWLSVLLPCRHIWRHREGEHASVLVLSTTLYGYVAWEVRFKKDDDSGRLDFGIEGERSLRIGAIEDPAEWGII